MSNYEFNAPQFRSFIESSDTEDDQFFFETQDNSSEPDTLGGPKPTSNGDLMFFSPMEPVSKEDNVLRPVTPRSAKTHSMVTRLDSSTYGHDDLEDIVLSRSQKRLSLKRKGSPVKLPSKFLSLAENIMHFQKDTPKRFRTRKAGDKFCPPKFAPNQLTVPTTPQFLSNQRIRCCKGLTQEERELKEIEDYQRQKEPPHPANRNILDKKFEITHNKQHTVPVEFNLTVQPKKEVKVQIVKPFAFKAQPIPVAVLSGPKNIRVPSNSEGKENLTTKLKPFSFDNRIKASFEKKKNMILQVLEKEKQRRVFRARPAPSYLNSARSPASTTSSRHSCMGEDLISPRFRARSPTVLYKQPFQVRRSRRGSTVPLDIELSTEKRARDRAVYNETVKQVQINNKLALQALQEEMEEQEEEEIKVLRIETVHKPLPLPKSASKKK